jgi:hypothetical protein
MNGAPLNPLASACPEGIKEKKTWQSSILWHNRDFHHDPIPGNKSHELPFYNITLSASWTLKPLPCQWLPTHSVQIHTYMGLHDCRGLVVDYITAHSQVVTHQKSTFKCMMVASACAVKAIHGKLHECIRLMVQALHVRLA